MLMMPEYLTQVNDRIENSLKAGSSMVAQLEYYEEEYNKKYYDVEDPEYCQIHCLRFEVDRSTG